MKALIQIRTTEEMKAKIQKQADTLNMSVSQLLLKSVEDNKDFISIFERFYKEFENINENISSTFYFFKQDIDELKEGKLVTNESKKHYVDIKIPKENIIEEDLIVLKGNVLEVLENNVEGSYFLVSNLINNTKMQLTYDKFTDDAIVKRRM